MDDSYEYFPIVLKSPVCADAFEFFGLADVSDSLDLPWSKSRLRGQFEDGQFLRDVSEIGNVELTNFLAKFCERYSFLGVVRLDCKHGERFEKNAWFVFQREKTLVGYEPTVLKMTSAPVGQYCYVNVRDWSKPDEINRYDTVQLFFNLFGGLRDSFPYLGGDYFPPRPSAMSEDFFCVEIFRRDVGLTLKRYAFEETVITLY